MQETPERWAQPLGWEDPLEEEMATHSSILPGKSHRQRSLEGYSPWGHKESDTTEQLNSSSIGTDGHTDTRALMMVPLDHLQWQVNPTLSSSSPCARRSPFTPVSTESQALGLAQIFLFYLSFFGRTGHSQDLSSPTRDWTQALSTENTEP